MVNEKQNEESVSILDYAYQEKRFYTGKNPSSIYEFWRYQYSSSFGWQVVLDTNLVVKFLEMNGFYYYHNDSNNESYVLVKETNSIIEKVNERYVLAFLQDYVKYRIPSDYIIEYDRLTRGKASIERAINELSIQQFRKVINNLKSKDVKILKDRPGVCYKFFKNLVVEITANEIELYYYPFLKFGLEEEYKVWKDNVINHKIDLVDIYHTAMAYNFHRLVTITKDINGNLITNEARFLALRSALGYLMYNYKNDTDTKAVVFCEEQISDNGGRTGKTLTCKMLEKLGCKIAKINGRNVDFNNRFLFQNVEESTNIILFDDTNDKFDFTALYSVITNGLTIEKKNKQAIQLSHQETPKFLITTNTVLTDESNSGKGRKLEVEFTDYFSDGWTPQDEFGCIFFDDWDDYDWNLFYNYMIGNIKLYLQKGLISYESKNLKNRKLSLKIEDDDLLDFCEDICREILTNKVNISSKEIFERWKAKYNDSNLSITKLSQSLKDFISINNLKAIKKGYYYVDRKQVRGFVYEPLYANSSAVSDFLYKDNIETGSNDTNGINLNTNNKNETTNNIKNTTSESKEGVYNNKEANNNIDKDTGIIEDKINDKEFSSEAAKKRYEEMKRRLQELKTNGKIDDDSDVLTL